MAVVDKNTAVIVLCSVGGALLLSLLSAVLFLLRKARREAHARDVESGSDAAKKTPAAPTSTARQNRRDPADAARLSMISLVQFPRHIEFAEAAHEPSADVSSVAPTPTPVATPRSPTAVSTKVEKRGHPSSPPPAPSRASKPKRPSQRIDTAAAPLQDALLPSTIAAQSSEESTSHASAASHGSHPSVVVAGVGSLLKRRQSVESHRSAAFDSISRSLGSGLGDASRGFGVPTSSVVRVEECNVAELASIGQASSLGPSVALAASESRSSTLDDKTGSVGGDERE
ncbi:hypothetical protein HK101_000548, partial [Irineochytrium annulatum]